MKSLKPFLAVLYIPIFGAIIVSPYNIRFYILIYVSLFILLMFQKRKTNMYFLNHTDIFFKFCIIFLFVGSVQEFIHGTKLLLIFRQSLTYAIVIGIILFLSKYNQDKLIEFLERVFYFIGITFIIQFILSAYESINNIYLVKEFSWALPDIYSPSMDKRFILNIFNIDTNFLKIFIHPFSGLLGTHNYWAVQLPFYNLIFLIMYHKTRKKYYLFLIILLFIAILLNTTRVSILTILVTNIVYVLYLNKQKNSAYYIASWGTVLSLIYVFSNLAVNYSQYFEHTDTLTLRFGWYTAFYQNIFTSEFPLLFGYGISQLDQVMENIRAYNFESAFFSILYTNGLIGLSIYIIFLVRIIFQGRKLSKINKYFSYLIVFNILGVSLTIGGVMTFYAFQFVALIYIYNVITDPSYNEDHAVTTVFSENNQTYKLKADIINN